MPDDLPDDAALLTGLVCAWSVVAGVVCCAVAAAGPAAFDAGRRLLCVLTTLLTAA